MLSEPETQYYYETAEAYLAGERLADRKHEYLAGVIYAMAGATRDHNRIAANILSDLLQQLRGRPCEPFSSDMKVRIRKDAAEFYYYPDVTVDCSGGPGASHFVEEPRVVFEVLSPDTQRIDHGEKLRNYQALASLHVYVLVDQFHIAVTVYRRTADGWKREFLSAKEDVLALGEIDCQLRMTGIYERTHLAA